MPPERKPRYVVVAQSIMFDQVIFYRGDILDKPSGPRLPLLIRAGLVRRLPVETDQDLPVAPEGLVLDDDIDPDLTEQLH